VATKAELEAELAQLRSELKEARDSASVDGAAAETTATKSADQPMSSEDASADDPAPKENNADILHSLQDGNFEGVIHQLIEELEGLPNRKPLLMALGALAVGYLIGRSGRKG
jgi:hypothetical protein